jgi:hypothetical protein
VKGDNYSGGGELGHCQVAARHQAGLYNVRGIFVFIRDIQRFPTTPLGPATKHCITQRLCQLP